MVIWIIVIAAVLFAILTAFLLINQDRMIFIPLDSFITTPSKTGMNHEEIFLEVSPEENIHAWYFPLSDSAPTILFCHGNAGNISYRLNAVNMFLNLGCSVLLFDYRGYGMSGGKPSEENVYADAEAALGWLKSRGTSEDEIIVFGESLGSAVAIELAARHHELGGLIIKSAFTNLAEVGHTHFPYLPVSLICRYNFNSLDRVKYIACPVIFSHSKEDELIPFRMGRSLFDTVTGSKTFVEITGGHNDRDYLSDENYHAALNEFIHLVEAKASHEDR